MRTRTGDFPIGLRRNSREWQKNLAALATWAKDHGFESIDLNRATTDDIRTLTSAGLRIGSADLLSMGTILAKDPAQRKDNIAANVTYIKEAAAAVLCIFFTLIVPGDPAAKRSENYAIAVESYAPIAQAIADAGASLAIEGWPGPWPHYANLCCTPETIRRFIKDVGAKSVGLNFDPSHLIRLGIDPIRFLGEFAPHVRHVHGKDTEIIPEAIYEYGLQQPAAFAPGHGFGEHTWRYTLPGHGQTRWSEVFRVLASAGFGGIVSVELEDENFNGTEDGEAGLLHSIAYLRGA